MKRLFSFAFLYLVAWTLAAQIGQSFNNLPVNTQKPPLHGRHWMAVTGKPLGAAAGAMIFTKGGNAVDAACAMLAATCTMWDVLSWGGETQALIYNPKTKKVIAINALGVAPTGATVDFFKGKGMKYPPAFGPLAAVTPGTPGGLMTMLAEYGTMSLKDVLAPAMQMAEGYPIEAQTANSIERAKEQIKQWPYSKKVFLPHLGEKREAPDAGEIFVQKDLLATLQKMVEAEQQALKKGKDRKQAIYAAYDRFYKGDIAKEIVRGSQEQGGLFTEADLANWKVKIEEPMMTNYKGIDVYKLQQWTQGPAMLQTLNILENVDLKSMGYNSTRYIHTVYQAINLAFADRDFYYGDPAFANDQQPMKGLLSKEYAKERVKAINWERNDAKAGPGDPYPFEGKTNPFADQLKTWGNRQTSLLDFASPLREEKFREDFTAGTTSVEAADKEGWVVSITPSGGWVPACIAGNTGVGMSQRMQSFVLDAKESPFNVVEPGKRPRVTLTPSMALKDGKPYLAFAKQAGDQQDQLLIQFFLNMVEFGMTVQEATEAPSFITDQMYSSFGEH
ncbi:MAG: gamma-glutamyltransferase, partial [Cyclobacteriaceae bacterium]|nr:gamma-glutamyltransferase [Cyclobacteriaceae bacterium]